MLAMNRLHLVGLAMVAGLVSACASSGGTERIGGTAGSVAWEVVDVQRSVSGNAVRWTYTIVMKETAGKAVQFETVDIRGYGTGRAFDSEVGGVSTVEWRRGLEPGAEIRVDTGYELTVTGGGSFGGLPSGSSSMTVFYRFHGRDDTGRSVTVDVRVPLSEFSGKVK